jgi:hypothetical protein
VAEWKYRIHRIECRGDTDLDNQIEGALRDYGRKGWELVQILSPERWQKDSLYRLIFKCKQPWMWSLRKSDDSRDASLLPGPL